MTLICEQRAPSADVPSEDPPSSRQSPVPLHLDPFILPAPTAITGGAIYRTRSVFRGTVRGIRPVRWSGGPVLEVDVDDGTGPFRLAFLGRRHIGGVRIGAHVVVSGMVGRHDDARVLLNPQFWLAGEA